MTTPLFFPFISLFSSLFSAALGVTIFYLAKKDPINRIYFAICLTGAYIGFVEFMQRQAESASIAIFWGKVGAFWYFVLPLLATFAMIYAGKGKWAKHPAVIALLYIPALAFSLAAFFTDAIVARLILEPWGYAPVANKDALIGNLSGVWPSIIGTCISGFMIFAFIKAPPGNRKKQAAIMMVSTFFPMIAGFITDGLPHLIPFHAPNLIVPAALLQQLLIAYSIKKYQLFRLDPATVAENIVETLPDALLVTDTEGKIQFFNRSALILAGEQGNLKETSARDFLPSGFDALHKEVVARSLVPEFEMSFLRGDKKEVPVSLSASLIRDPAGATRGLVLIAKDITNRKKTEEELRRSKIELEEKFHEADRFNKIAVDRELKMIELKKRIAELEGAAAKVA